MAFGAERKRLRGLLNPGETILASDLLGGVVEMPESRLPPVLVVTTEAIYILLSGSDSGEYRIGFTELLTVARRTDLTARAMTLVIRGEDGPQTITCLFHARDRRGRTGDLITERFFGRVIKNTEG